MMGTSIALKHHKLADQWRISRGDLAELIAELQRLEKMEKIEGLPSPSIRVSMIFFTHHKTKVKPGPYGLYTEHVNLALDTKQSLSLADMAQRTIRIGRKDPILSMEPRIHFWLLIFWLSMIGIQVLAASLGVMSWGQIVINSLIGLLPCLLLDFALNMVFIAKYRSEHLFDIFCDRVRGRTVDELLTSNDKIDRIIGQRLAETQDD